MVDRGEYFASRKWAVLKKQVRGRSRGKCERCGRPANQVHHLTYARFGEELLSDLQHVCAPCHEYLSAASDYDPATAPVVVSHKFSPEDEEYLREQREIARIAFEDDKP